jgi:indole-3-glycerol phosphate synthase
MNILEQIVADKRIEIAGLKERVPEHTLVLPEGSGPDFMSALRAQPLGLIAEVKRKSPSAGVIRDPFDPATIACAYADGGATAISCLMDTPYFGGGVEDFRAVRSAVSLPMLYKEFIIDLWQITHAQSVGASGVLLIASVLQDDELHAFSEEILQRGMTPLIEVHNKVEMERAIDVGAGCIGINNRNLKTFETSLEVTAELASMAPRETVLVSESGIKTAEDALMLKKMGAHALLVGEQLLREDRPDEAVKELLSKLH